MAKLSESAMNSYHFVGQVISSFTFDTSTKQKPTTLNKTRDENKTRVLFVVALELQHMETYQTMHVTKTKE